MPEKFLERGKTYVFFSHVIKGQAYNMSRLKKMMNLGCQLLDYECITNDQGVRLVAFGRFAGLAGIIQSLWVLGRKYASAGIDTPFSSLLHPYEYSDLDDARDEMTRIGEAIRVNGLPDAARPFICGFSGYGKVSLGAQEMFDLLGVTQIDPGEVAKVYSSGSGKNGGIYKVVYKEEHLARPKKPNTPFVLQDYYASPENFEPIFEASVPYLTMLVNCIYWEDRFPRLVTRSFLDQAWNQEPFSLKVVGDISCDIGGAIEITHKPTEPDEPAFTYIPQTHAFVDGCVADGISVMAVDNLPCEFPKASSRAFGDALIPFVGGVAGAKYDRPLDSSGLPEPLARAAILYRGKLTPSFAYLESHVK